MVGRIGVSIAFVGLLALWTGTSSAAEIVTCEVQSINLKWREYRCPLTASGKGQRLRFKADFADSHDDTELSINLTLDGEPVVCTQGSRTWLNGEDGNVTLDCHLMLNGTVGAKKMLGARINIWHADLLSVELSVLPQTKK